jgi:hypothetical protein
MKHSSTILMTEFVTHDVKRFILTKPRNLRIPLIPATDSEGRRPPVPEQGGRFLSERSDAGFSQFSKS